MLRGSPVQDQCVRQGEQAEDEGGGERSFGFGECTQGVEHSVGEDAKEQRPALYEHHHVQKSYQHGANYLHQIVAEAHSAAVYEVDNMSDAKGHCRHCCRPAETILCHGFEQKSAEDHLLQKSHANHSQKVKYSFQNAVI